jgi:single-strand DNA-binding protein
MSYHKLTAIGRLVGDPRFQPFSNGGGVAKFGIGINFTRPKKNPETGLWEGESFIIDVDAFNRENGVKLGDLVMQYLKKGSQVYIEGRLKPNEYTDKTGTKVFKPVLVADIIEFLDGRGEGGGMADAPAVARPARPAPVTQPARSSGSSFGAKQPAEPLYKAEPEDPVETSSGGGGDDIPF